MNGIKWTKQEDLILMENFEKHLTVDMMHLLPGRSLSSIRGRAYDMGLKKTKETLCKMGDSLIDSGKAHRFQNGLIPFNKGKKMPDELKEHIKHTFFQKGNKPHNTQPDGTINERRDKSGVIYKYIKIKDSYWRLLHRVVWEQHNGPIPKGHRIHFLNGDTTNCAIENLRCLSGEQAMDLNRLTQYPIELQQVIKLKNKLTKKIKDHGTQ